MTELPKATHTGSFRLFDIDVVCHRLDNGQAIIEQDSMARLLEVMGEDSGVEFDEEEFAKFQAWLRGDLT